MEHPVRDFHAELEVSRRKKPDLRGKPGFAIYDLRLSPGSQTKVPSFV
jgi:hypothetical protein